MDLLIVRHAVAEEQDAQRWPDDRERPLTHQGVRRFRRIAQALLALAPEVDALWSSPLRRAWQTADLLAEAGWPNPKEAAWLEPSATPNEAVAVLRRAATGKLVALVGHEPHLHQTIGHLLVGSPEHALVEMKKGGAAMLRFSGKPAQNAGVLVWLAPPRLLARE